MKDGWEPLCEFLDISKQNCPTTPFPKSNSARAVQIQAIFSIIFPLSIILFIIFFMFSFIFQKSMGTTILNWFSDFCKRLVLSFLGLSSDRNRRNNNNNDDGTNHCVAQSKSSHEKQS